MKKYWEYYWESSTDEIEDGAHGTNFFYSNNNSVQKYAKQVLEWAGQLIDENKAVFYFREIEK